MALNPTLKIASIAVGAGGIVTGGAVGIHNYLSKSNEEGKKEDSTPTPEKDEKQTVVETKKTIAQSLSDKKQLLTVESQDAKGNENGGTFKGLYDQEHNTNTPGTFSNGNELKQKGDNAPTEFKQKCKDNSEKLIEGNDKLLKEVEKYCTKDI